MPHERIIFSGAGGQGLMFIGKLFARTALDIFPHITFIPSYGAEMRGGTSNCRIILSHEEIASPIVEQADSILAMNQPSVDRFLPMLAPGGTAVLNSSMAVAPENMNAVEVPATEWAQEAGDIRAANVIMLGAYVRVKSFFDLDKILGEIVSASSEKGKKAVNTNKSAFLKGWNSLD